MCKHMVDGNEQKGHGKTTAVSEDAEAEIFITFKWKQYIPDSVLNLDFLLPPLTVEESPPLQGGVLQ